MVHFVGLDVPVKETSVCIVDDAGKVISELKVPTEPADIIALLSSLGPTFGRNGIEAGPLSQWLVNAFGPQSLGRCSPSCTRCCSTRSAATRCADD
jgi:transposase